MTDSQILQSYNYLMERAGEVGIVVTLKGDGIELTDGQNGTIYGRVTTVTEALHYVLGFEAGYSKGAVHE